MDFVLNSSSVLVIADVYGDSVTQDQLRENLLLQVFVTPITMIVALALLHVCTSRREGMGIVSLFKILIGMCSGVLGLIFAIVIDALFLYSGYRLPLSGLQIVGLLPRVGDALVMVGAVQFLF